MPRARANPEEAGAKKRTATKRARSTSTTRVRRAPKKTTSARANVPAESLDVPVASVRKAPTRIAADRATERSHTVALFGVLVVSGLLLVTGIVIGVADDGQIDVAAVIAEENERISRGEVLDPQTGQPVTRTIPVQNTAVQSSGGLRPSTRPTTTPAATASAESDTDISAAPDAATTTTATSSEVSSEESPDQSEGTTLEDDSAAVTSERDALVE